MQDLPHGPVLEVDRHNGVAQLLPSPQREPDASLVQLLSSVPQVSVSLVCASPCGAESATVLAGLTAVVWAFSLASLLSQPDGQRSSTSDTQRLRRGSPWSARWWLLTFGQ
jgi:hypothetical protein